MNDFRYQLERYRGRGSRYVCPQCGRKYVFTRYVDTHNNNTYLSDNVGKCNRLDKCGYHYTPKQYFEDNPWLRDKDFSLSLSYREKERERREKEPPKPVGRLPLHIKLLNLSNKVTILPLGSVTAVVSTVADV